MPTVKMNSRRTTSALTLCVESLFGSEQIEVTTHHEQLSADTSSHANGCKGISSADGSGHDEKEGAADHLSIVASTIFRSIVRVYCSEAVQLRICSVLADGLCWRSPSHCVKIFDGVKMSSK